MQEEYAELLGETLEQLKQVMDELVELKESVEGLEDSCCLG